MTPVPPDNEPVPPGLTPAQWAAVIERFELSAQQAHVLALVADGRKEQAIAIRLNISLNTVKEYMKRIRLRLGERNRAGLIRQIYITAATAHS